jgi:hypothetical protein
MSERFERTGILRPNRSLIGHGSDIEILCVPVSANSPFQGVLESNSNSHLDEFRQACRFPDRALGSRR